MLDKSFTEITHHRHKGIDFTFFHTAQNVYVYNAFCEFYGSYYDEDSFFNFYAKEGEKLNLSAVTVETTKP